jgi:cytochrome b
MAVEQVKVWDPLVRVFHWALVVSFFTAYLTEDDVLTLHVWAGYAVLGLVVFRILWGLVGTRHARFSDFVYSPRAVRAFLKDTLLLRAKRYLGHNPAGGAMIVLMLISLVLTTLTGLMVYGAAENAGPLAGWLGQLGEEGGDVFEAVHEFLANLCMMLVAIHVVGVLVESLVHRENLVRAMWNGRKRVDDCAGQA